MLALKGQNPFQAAFGLVAPSGKALTYGAAAVAGGLAAWSLFGKASQQQAATQTGTAQAPTAFSFYQVPNGGPMTINNPSGGTATTTQAQTQTQVDFGGATNLILLAVVAGVVLMLFKR